MNCAEFRVAQTTGGREKEDQEEVGRGGKIDHNNDKTRWDECSGWHVLDGHSKLYGNQ